MDQAPQRPSLADPGAALLGRVIAGKFLIESKVGGGAMGAVYRARQIALDKTIAVKVLHRQYADDPTFMARFEREAKAATRVDHPNSMRVIDFGQEADGLLYIAMEFIDGTDLFRVLQQYWPLEPARIVDILSQALGAIAVAHDLGIVHRDLKPENLMMIRGVDDEGRPCDVVKVCDFGIATFTENRGTLALGGPKLTSHGLVVGTPEYMSPEQARGEPLDARSDIYSTGVILYQLLTGRLPFEADTALGIVFKHVTEEPVPPRKHHPAADPRLEAVCLRAMRKRREERQQSARELRAELRAALDGESFSRGPTELPAAPLSTGVDARALAGTAPALAAAPTALATPAQVPVATAIPSTRSKPTLDAPVALPANSEPPARRRSIALAATAAAVGAAALIVVATRPRGGNAPAPHVSAAMIPVAPTTLAPIPVAPLPSVREAPAPPPVAPAPQVTKTSTVKLAPRTVTVAPSRAVTMAVNDEPPPVAPTLQEPPQPAPAPAVAVASAAPTPAAVTSPTSETPGSAASPQATDSFDPARGRVDYTVTTAGGGATVRAVQRALARAQSRWTQCYRGALERREKAVEDRGSMHLVTDEVGNVISAQIDGLDSVPRVKQCIVNASHVRIDGVDTGDAWADVRIVLRAE